MFHKLSKPPAFSRVKCHSDGNKLLGTYFDLPYYLLHICAEKYQGLAQSSIVSNTEICEIASDVFSIKISFFSCINK